MNKSLKNMVRGRRAKIACAVLALLAVVWVLWRQQYQQKEGIGYGSYLRWLTDFFNQNRIYGQPTNFSVSWFSFQDNTPCNSSGSASGRKLRPFISVAVKHTMLTKSGGKLNYGDLVFVKWLYGRPMPNGTKHTGYLVIDDYCGDNGDDSYCTSDDKYKYPLLDVYIGDYKKAAMRGRDGPMGSGQTPVTATFYKANLLSRLPHVVPANGYGGAEKGSGRCNDCKGARQEQSNAWDYNDQGNHPEWC